MKASDAWKHKDVWKRAGRNFTVEISRHGEPSADEGDCYDSEGPHRWCIYVYVYPKHPKFADFDPAGAMYQQPSFGMHAGNSLFKVHRKEDGSIASFQVGCDYNHMDDWPYTQMATADDAASVFIDANEIVQMLTNTDVQQ